MNKNQKRIIALKARAVEKALSKFKPQSSKNRRYLSRENRKFRKAVGRNNLVFNHSYQTILGMGDSNKAKFLDMVLHHNDYDHHRNNAHRWALWHSVDCFDMKLLGVEFALGVKTGFRDNGTIVKEISNWLVGGRKYNIKK